MAADETIFLLFFIFMFTGKINTNYNSLLARLYTIYFIQRNGNVTQEYEQAMSLRMMKHNTIDDKNAPCYDGIVVKSKTIRK